MCDIYIIIIFPPPPLINLLCRLTCNWCRICCRR